MTVEIRSQRAARAAFEKVERRQGPDFEKYVSFARAFPTLIHTSGLAQATAFAIVKGAEKAKVLEDLAQVLTATDSGWKLADGHSLHHLAVDSETDVFIYMRLTRQALEGASWIKRYAEALFRPDETTSDQPHENESVEEV